MPARPGDIIMVPGGGEVFIQGWVGKPGAYKITSGLTILGAVAAAGGTLFPADNGSIELIRTNNQGQKTSFVANLDAIKAGEQPDLPLREGDVIDVSSTGPKLALTVFIVFSPHSYMWGLVFLFDTGDGPGERYFSHERNFSLPAYRARSPS